MRFFWKDADFLFICPIISMNKRFSTAFHPDDSSSSKSSRLNWWRNSLPHPKNLFQNATFFITSITSSATVMLSVVVFTFPSLYSPFTTSLFQCKPIQWTFAKLISMQISVSADLSKLPCCAYGNHCNLNSILKNEISQFNQRKKQRKQVIETKSKMSHLCS